MGKTFLILAILAYFNIADAGILLWSPIPLHVPALKNFRQTDFDDLLTDLQQPNILAFTTNSKDIIPKRLNNFYSSYVATTDLDLENSKLLSDDLETNTNIIKESLNEKNDKDLLIVISLNNKRSKREENVDDNNSVKVVDKNESSPMENTIVEYEGPVVYSGNRTLILYSPKPLFLRINTSTLLLGPAIKDQGSTRDNRDGYSRLISTIIVGKEKVILRFKFLSLGSYWSLASVEVHRKEDNKSYKLTIGSTVGAPMGFSYNCHKDTVFTDPSGNVELVVYQIQVQMDAKKGRFSDSYNCVNFTTVPIWSGLLVSISLIFGFFIALAALGSIKTMDKFDNYKTKQLNITVAE